MSKLTILMIISCILVFSLAEKEFLKSDYPSCLQIPCIYAAMSRYCVLYDDGSIKDFVRGCYILPCAKNIVGYWRGSCRENGKF